MSPAAAADMSSPRYEQPQYEQPFALQYERTDMLPEELPPHEPVPLFLSNYEEESHQQLSEYAFASGDRRFGSGGLKKARAGRIVTGVVVVSAIAAVLALFSIDSTRSRHLQRLARRRGRQRAATRSACRDGAGTRGHPAAHCRAAARRRTDRSRGRGRSPLAAHCVGIGVAVARRNHRRLSDRAQGQGRGARAGGARSCPRGRTGNADGPVAAVAPAVREPAPVTREAAPARRIDPDELAALLKRAKSLLAIGDITSARLLLERAADAQEAEAALMLAGTYDPQVLGSQDLRSVTPDPAAARVWYQKAAQLGSADAKAAARPVAELVNYSRPAQRIPCDICSEWHCSP